MATSTSFGAAFKDARKKLGAGKTFTWKGKTYTTDTAPKTTSPKKPATTTPAASARPKARSAGVSSALGKVKPKASTAGNSMLKAEAAKPKPKAVPIRSGATPTTKKPTSSRDPQVKKQFADMRAASPLGRLMASVSGTKKAAAERATAAQARKAAAAKGAKVKKK
jgi:hypothetical protein